MEGGKAPVSAKEFAKIAVGLREHPKVLQAGDEAGWLYVCAILWSKEHDTDGLVPEYAVARLTGLRHSRRALDACVRAGLMESVEDGWRIHDYLDHQESAEKRRAAGRKAAAVRWGKQPQSDSDAKRTTVALRGRSTEEEEDREEEPPRPPRGGRGRERVGYEGKLAEFTAKHFPGIEPGYVAHFAGQLWGRNTPATVAALRPLLEGFANGTAPA